MPQWMWFVIAAFLVADIAVITFIVKKKMRQAGLSFGQIQSISKQVHERVSEYMRANYSGSRAQLPAALRGAMNAAAEVAARENVPLDPDMIKALVKSAVANQRIATYTEIERALEQIAGEDRASRAA